MYPAERAIWKQPKVHHPDRTLITGRSQMGKTTWAVKLILDQYRLQVDRIFMLCPTWKQKTFDPIRHLVLERDVYTEVTKETFSRLSRELEVLSRRPNPPRVLVYVDDCAGTKAIHGNGTGPFAHLAIQTPHWNCSMIVVSQQPSRVDPSFRNNCENIAVFPSEGKLEVKWLKENYQSILMEDVRCVYFFSNNGIGAGSLCERMGE